MANQFAPFSEEEVKKIAEEFPFKGPPLYKEMPGRTKWSITSKASKMCLKYIPKRERVDINRVINLAEEGKRIKEISKDIGISQVTLWRACALHKVKIREIHKEIYMTNKSNTCKKNFFLRQIKKYNLDREFSECCICGWKESSIDFAHMQSAAKNGRYVIDNIVPLCPNHHRIFDHGKLNSEESEKIADFNGKMNVLSSIGGKEECH